MRVEQQGWTASESGVREALEQLIANAPGRVLVTTFASNIGRLREVVRSAHKLGRTTAIVGRSMEENLKVARELGFMNVPAGSIREVREVNILPPTRSSCSRRAARATDQCAQPHGAWRSPGGAYIRAATRSASAPIRCPATRNR